MSQDPIKVFSRSTLQKEIKLRCVMVFECLSSCVKSAVLPELREVLGSLAEQPLASKAELHAWFKAVITAPAEVFLPQLEKLADRFRKNGKDGCEAVQNLVKCRLSTVYCNIVFHFPFFLPFLH